MLGGTDGERVSVDLGGVTCGGAKRKEREKSSAGKKERGGEERSRR